MAAVTTTAKAPTTASVTAMAAIRFEDSPVQDASGATITISNAGIRIKFPTGETRYYYGQGPLFAEPATIHFAPIPELQGPSAPKPTAELVAKYGNRHMAVGAVGCANISVGDGQRKAAGATAAGAVGCLFHFGRGS